MSEMIERALNSATDTKTVVLSEGAVTQTGKVYRELFGTQKAVIVADERTYAVAGEQVKKSLEQAGIELAPSYIFPGDPELYAKYENIKVLVGALSATEAKAVAIGGGTLNDITKRASDELKRPYLTVGTAASMDGFCAFGSSIAVDGFKQTLNCAPPAAVIADLSIMAEAPNVMTASGYGDLIGKIPAGADWIIADALGVEKIDPNVWELVQGPLRQSLTDPEGLRRGSIPATEKLVEGLIMSGLAMQAHRSSRPASGAEHQFSHIWEMEGHGVDIKPRRLSHGFKVGIGTVAVSALYEVLLDMDIEALDIDAAVAKWPGREELEAQVREANPHPNLMKAAVEQSMAKWIAPEELRARLVRVREIWPQLREKLRKQLIPATQIQDSLRAVGAPAHPAEIKIDQNRFRETYRRAQMIRKRYTVLDFVLEAGILDEITERLFSPDGFWGKQDFRLQ